VSSIAPAPPLVKPSSAGLLSVFSSSAETIRSLALLPVTSLTVKVRLPASATPELAVPVEDWMVEAALPLTTTLPLSWKDSPL